MRTVVVLGAGIGGKISSLGIAREFKDWKVILVGPRSEDPSGLFYFNKRIPGIADKEVKVSYSLVGNFNTNSFKDYQIKSRGFYSPSINISSFNKIGQTETGYFLNSDLDEEISKCSNLTYLDNNCTGFDKNLIIADNYIIEYDKLISTIPIYILSKLSGEVLDRNYLICKPVYVKDVISNDFDSSQVSSIIVNYDITDGPYYRHTAYYDKNREPVKFSSETIQNLEDSEMRVMYPGKIFKSSRIEDKVNFYEEKYKIRILGRYARWDYHFTVDQTYEESLKYMEE